MEFELFQSLSERKRNKIGVESRKIDDRNLNSAYGGGAGYKHGYTLCISTAYCRSPVCKRGAAVSVLESRMGDCRFEPFSRTCLLQKYSAAYSFANG